MINKTKFFNFSLFVLITLSLLFSGCGGKAGNGAEMHDTGRNNTQISDGGTENADETANRQNTDAESSDVGKPQSSKPDIDLTVVKPNESGKIMVVMFHNFIEKYQKGDKEYTTTFEAFRSLLQTLYDSGYRLVGLKDYLEDNIDVSAGRIPMVFTFDDGTPGQFNLVENNGKLSVNSRSAVGIMEEFNRAHRGFGLEGTFVVNLGDQAFSGSGTLPERLEYLIGEGFEIGNHTYSHVNLKKTRSADEIQKEIGGNQKKMYELVPGYEFISFSLPNGGHPENLEQYVARGEYEGIGYNNRIIVEVGWDPAPSPVSTKFDPLSTHRVRAPGISPVDSDLAWWLKKLTRDEQYVSDGNPDTITVPGSNETDVDPSKLNGKKLIVY